MERSTHAFAFVFAMAATLSTSCAEPEEQKFDAEYRETPASLTTLNTAMRSSVMAKSSPRAVICSPILELPSTSLCFFKTRPGMNAALSRIQQRVETSRGLLTDREHVTNPANQAMDGHDLRVGDIAIVLQEHDLARERTESDAAPEDLAWMIDIERAFREQYLIPLVVLAKSEVLLALVADGDDAALHHELLHAAFFTNPGYQVAVKGFWEGLSQEQSAGIKAQLRLAYDITNEALVLNELQAYLLMIGAQNELLSEWTQLAQPLTRALESNGISPIELQVRN